MDVERQDPGSSWALYKKSLSLRHSHPALGGEGVITWIDAPVGVMRFTREPGLEVVVNTTQSELSIPIEGTSILLESAEGSSFQGGQLVISANTTIWLQR